MRETLYAYYRKYGYSPHGLVAISEEARGWEATRAHGAVCYLEVGRIWLASEPLTDEDDLAEVTREFLEYAGTQKRLAAFFPVTERLARVATAMGLDCMPVGQAPYFDMTKWTSQGRRLYTVRKELRKAHRAGLTVECVAGQELPREEAQQLQKDWIMTRRTTPFAWIFTQDTFNFADYKKHFLARAPNGRLGGLLSAAPVPARGGYYLKDLNRHPDAPKGTSDLLMVTAMEHLRDEGVRFVTPGGVPLHGIRDAGAVTNGAHPLLLRMMTALQRRGEGLYGFSGLYLFKSRFAPTWWEHEYGIAPRALWSGMRVGLAAARATAPQGIADALLRASWHWRA